MLVPGMQATVVIAGQRSLCYKKTFIGKNLFSKFRKSQKKSIPKVKVKKKVKLKSQKVKKKSQKNQQSTKSQKNKSNKNFA